MFRDKSEYIAAPSMIMALGIYLRFAGPHLATGLGAKDPNACVAPVVYCLAVFGTLVFGILAVRFAQAPAAFWEPIAPNFVIGTWAAGANVLGATLAKVAGHMALAKIFNSLGWVCWVYYMAWFIRALRIHKTFPGITGGAFLTTVSAQSVVVSSLSVWEGAARVAPLFLGLNLLGLALYCLMFYHTWVLPGVRTQLANWVAPNNITHGALSITVLAQELLYLAAPQRFAFLMWTINAVWCVAVILFLAAVALEFRMAVTADRSRVLGYRMTNFARNFTYGMLFACTYLGAEKLPMSLMAQVATPALVMGFAVIVTLINLWEVFNQIRHYVTQRNRSTAKPDATGCTPRREATPGHGG